MKVLFLLLALTSILAYPKTSHAIIFLPAIILIPISKIVAVIIGSLILPSLGFSLFWKKFFGGTWKKILISLVLFLIVIALGLTLLLYLQNPNRPFI